MGGLVLALFVLILSMAVVYFRYPIHDRRAMQADSGTAVVPGGGREPITLIPLDLKLDARKVALGSRLFHDPRLSHDITISCAHCHNLANDGMDGLPRSIGVAGKQGLVNTPTVFNSRFNFRQYWDGSAATLEDHIDFQKNNPCEMGSTWDEVIAKLGKDAGYRRDFAAIYPESIQPLSVRRDRHLRAFPDHSKREIRPFFARGDKQALDNDALAGYELFKSLGCISCHQGMNVGGNMYEKLGIVDDYFAHCGKVQEADFGRFNVTGIEDHSTLEAGLRHALSRQQFALFYQIQVNSDNQPIGAEVLLRWIPPLRGVILPGEFIPLAEETGLILPSACG